MKKKIESFEEFEKRLKYQSSPKAQNIEVFEKKLFEGEKRTKPYLKVSIITVLFSLFSFASIGLAVEFIGWKFFNSEGEQIYEIQPLDQYNVDLSKKMSLAELEYYNMKEEIRENLASGKFAYFLSVEGYELDPTSVRILANDQKIDSVNKIPNTINSLHLKDNLFGTYMLKEGSLQYELPKFDSSKKAKELYAKAKQEGVPYVVEEADLTSEISSIDLLYEHKESNQGIQIHIFKAGKGMFTSKDLTGYTQVNEMGIEFLLDKKEQELIYVVEEDGKNLRVSIRFTHKDTKPINIEDFMSVVKEIKNM